MTNHGKRKDDKTWVAVYLSVWSEWIMACDKIRSLGDAICHSKFMT